MLTDVCTQDEKVKAVVEQLQTNPDAVMGQIEADEELQRKLIQRQQEFYQFLANEDCGQ